MFYYSWLVLLALLVHVPFKNPAFLQFDVFLKTVIPCKSSC